MWNAFCPLARDKLSSFELLRLVAALDELRLGLPPSAGGGQEVSPATCRVFMRPLSPTAL